METTARSPRSERQTEQGADDPTLFDRIVHPTDLSQAGTPAFDHALRLAVAGRSHFHLVHAAHLSHEDDGDWDAFPGVRSTLRRWGMLPPDAPPEAVDERLGVRVTKAEVPDRDPVERMVHFIDEHRGNLLVLATSARGPGYWLRGSLAEKLARRPGCRPVHAPRRHRLRRPRHRCSDAAQHPAAG